MFSKAWNRVAFGASAVALSFGMAANAQALEVGQCMTGPEMTTALKAENQRSVMTATRIGVMKGDTRDYAFKAINVLTSTEHTGFNGYILQQELNQQGQPTAKLCVDAKLSNITLIDVNNVSSVKRETLVNVDRKLADAQCKGSKTCAFHNDSVQLAFSRGVRVAYQGFDSKTGQIFTVSTGTTLPSSGDILKTDAKTGVAVAPFALLDVNYTPYANQIGRTIPAPGTDLAGLAPNPAR